ncbi:MAG TPA: hypothetical protein VK968_10510, partial [Roseimicrobium sp.]|nr:hypothetical protein [Roseimicrobium sp.]
FQVVGAQNAADAERLRNLGCGTDAVYITGNLKFDGARPDPVRRLDPEAILRQLGVPAGARVIVAGSTHDGEEAILAEQFQRLRKKFPDLFLILVPRHFERAKAVVADLNARGVKFQLRSEMTPETRRAAGEVDCLLVNTTGELKYFYEVATVVFVGKSLTAEGGQNPIEPAALGKALVFGPNMQNFRPVVATFRERDAVMQVADAMGVEAAFEELLGNPARREQLGRNAAAVVQENQGATQRTVDVILERLPEAIRKT